MSDKRCAQALLDGWTQVDHVLEGLLRQRWGGVKWEQELLCATCTGESLAALAQPDAAPAGLLSELRCPTVPAKGSAALLRRPRSDFAPPAHVPADVLAMPPEAMLPPGVAEELARNSAAAVSERRLTARWLPRRPRQR